MNGKDLLLGMNDIDDIFIEEADVKSLKKKHVTSWKQWISIAACLGVVVAITFIVYPDTFSKVATKKPESKQYVDKDKPEGSIAPNTDDIVVNEIIESSADTEAAKLWYDPELYEFPKWNEEEVQAYYGKDLTPRYVPEGLYPATYNGKVNPVIKKDAQHDEAIVNDMITFSFYHAYNEEGMPKWTDDRNAEKGFTLTASKVGIVRDCVYIMPGEDEIKISNINGVSVTIGYRSMPYGPYDSETHEPSGYYDLYVAQFKYDGIEYEIVTDQLPLEEVVEIVRGVIS